MSKCFHRGRIERQEIEENKQTKQKNDTKLSVPKRKKKILTGKRIIRKIRC